MIALSDGAPWTAGEAIVAAIKMLGSKPVTSASLIATFNTFKNWQGTFNAPLTWNGVGNENPTYCNQVQGSKNGQLANANPTGQRFTCWTTSTAPPKGVG